MEALEQIALWAAKGAEALAAFGSPADYSEGTLPDVDRLLIEHSDVDPGDAFDLGCYFGEVVCRATGSRWSPMGSQHPDGEPELEVTMPRGSRFWPVAQVMKRVGTSADRSVSLAAFVHALRAIDARGP